MVAGSPSDAPVAPRRWQRPHQSVQVHIFSARPVSGREDVAVMAIGWAWQFQKDLREAYVWHRCIGESRRLRALACAWRTALILMTGSLVTPASSLLGPPYRGWPAGHARTLPAESPPMRCKLTFTCLRNTICSPLGIRSPDTHEYRGVFCTGRFTSCQPWPLRLWTPQ
jgi:hypothetical protein